MHNGNTNAIFKHSTATKHFCGLLPASTVSALWLLVGLHMCQSLPSFPTHSAYRKAAHKELAKDLLISSIIRNDSFQISEESPDNYHPSPKHACICASLVHYSEHHRSGIHCRICLNSPQCHTQHQQRDLQHREQPSARCKLPLVRGRQRQAAVRNATFGQSTKADRKHANYEP